MPIVFYGAAFVLLAVSLRLKKDGGFWTKILQMS